MYTVVQTAGQVRSDHEAIAVIRVITNVACSGVAESYLRGLGLEGALLKHLPAPVPSERSAHTASAKVQWKAQQC
jgi:hypothetical protein